jgi:asparagine synthase (glutamine-hydrolysing)
MCGLAGFFSRKEAISKEELVNMTAPLNHRGPDAEGYFYDKEIGLGHKRLAIIDLSDDANQPFHSQCGRYIIIFNGEVFNYKELKKELDVPLKTNSDTETIVELFAKYGSSFISKVIGMYVILIYDTKEKELHVFRDRLGVKPLYYIWDGDNFFFASEVKSFLAVKRIKDTLKVNKESVNDFLQLGYIPQPNTIYKTVKKFPAGTYLRISNNCFDFKQYWSLEEKVNAERIVNLEQAKSEFKSLLESSLKYRLISDVPLGIFLSGGVDSSLLTAVAQNVSSQRIKTFAIGFDDPKYNELVYARKVASHLNTEHHELVVTEKDVAGLVLGLMDRFDEPFADASSFPSYLLSEFASKQVKVVLSGEGADEIFMGYGFYQWAEVLSKKRIRHSKYLIHFLLAHSPNNRHKRAANLFMFNDKNKIKKHIFSQEQYLFMESELSTLLNPDYQVESGFDENLIVSGRKLSSKEEQALFDIKYYLQDDLLIKMDKTSMFCSIEAREPYLDHRLVEFGINLPEEFKIKNGVSKYLLKQLLYDYLPKEYFERPKWGFTIPLSKWLKNDLRFLIEDYLSESKIKEGGVFNYRQVENLKKRFFNGENYLYNRLWAIILVQRWILNSSVLTK